MDLEELRKQLYREKGEFEKREEGPKEFQPGQASGPSNGFRASWESEPQKTAPPFLNDRRKKILKFSVIGLVVVLILAAAFIFLKNWHSFDSSKVSLTIFGPDRLMSGEEVQYVVRYKNNTNVDLKDVKLTFIYPENSVPSDDKNTTKEGEKTVSVVDVGQLAAGKDGQAGFGVAVTGLKSEKKDVEARLNYYPVNISSSFENTAKFESTIFSVPLVLDSDLPERVVSGQDLNFSFKYLNTADVSFSNLVLEIEYPPGFSFKSASPAPEASSSNRWPISEISPGEEGRIAISGVLSGTKDEVKIFGAKIGVVDGNTSRTISEDLASTLISVSPLSVELKVNDQRDYLANVGEKLHYLITYQNTVDIPLNSAFIVLKFDSRIIDYTSLKISNGFFNDLDNSITWNESTFSDLKMLEPGEKKEIDFDVNVKGKLPINNFNDKNFFANSVVKIDSLSVPVALEGTQLAGTDSVNIKLNSKLAIASKGYYNDNEMPNSGPLPPTVGQQTTYTIHWLVTNLANDVDDVVVESYLPPYVRWLNKFEPSQAKVKYDSSTGKITWTIGNLVANTGVLSLSKNLVFQIGLIPGSDQVGSVVELVKDAVISGKDSFTASALEASDSAIKTDLPDDPTIQFEQWKVRQ